MTNINKLRIFYMVRVISLIVNAIAVVFVFKFLSIPVASLIASILFLLIGLEVVWFSIYLKEKISVFFSLLFFLGFALPIGGMRLLIGEKEQIIAAGYGSILDVLHFYSSKIFLFLILVCIYELYKNEQKLKAISKAHK